MNVSKNNIVVFVGLVFLPFFSFAQEFTLKKTPEEKQRDIELKEEKKYLEFQTHFFEAIHQKASEDYNKAIESLEDCKQIYPDDAGMNFEFAKNYLLLKDYENAIYFDEKALKVKKENYYILEHLKKTYRAQHDFENALVVQHRIVAINPSKKQDLILLYIGDRQRDKATEVFQELEKKHQFISNKEYYKRVLFPKKSNHKATKKARKTLHEIAKNKTKKSTIKTRVSKSRVKIQTGRNLELSAKQKERKIATNTKQNKPLTKNEFVNSKSYHNLKTIIAKAAKQKKYRDVATDCKMGLQYFPAQNYLYFMQGKAQNKLSEYQEAVAVLKAGLDFVIDDKPTEINFYEQIIKAYKGLGSRKDVSEYTKKLELLK